MNSLVVTLSSPVHHSIMILTCKIATTKLNCTKEKY